MYVYCIPTHYVPRCIHADPAPPCVGTNWIGAAKGEAAAAAEGAAAGSAPGGSAPGGAPEPKSLQRVHGANYEVGCVLKMGFVV